MPQTLIYVRFSIMKPVENENKKKMMIGGKINEETNGVPK
jgi:hypothetical protein